MIPFNINDYVMVKLTAHGRALHREAYDALMKKFPAIVRSSDYSPVEEDADGWSKWQLWELMHSFGKHCYNGCELPFETDIQIVTAEIPK